MRLEVVTLPRRTHRVVLAALILACMPPRLATEPPKFSLPLACEPKKSCYIQNFVDIDPGPLARDFSCSEATYDTHSGTDFRLLSAAAAAQGVAVLAAADGTVLRTRDGVEDRFVTPETRERVMPIGCGNAVVIDHGAGVHTMYCHLRRGSLAVTSGAVVRRGQPIAAVGYSGLTEFAHLHFEVLRDGTSVDPFTGAAAGGACLADPTKATGLWREPIRDLFGAHGAIIGAGFTSKIPDRDALEVDHAITPPEAGTSQLFYVGRFINVRAGDRVKVTMLGPNGFRMLNLSDPLDRHRARHLSWGTAATRGGAVLPAGDYHGKLELIRDGTTIDQREETITLVR